MHLGECLDELACRRREATERFHDDRLDHVAIPKRMGIISVCSMVSTGIGVGLPQDPTSEEILSPAKGGVLTMGERVSTQSGRNLQLVNMVKIQGLAVFTIDVWLIIRTEVPSERALLMDFKVTIGRFDGSVPYIANPIVTAAVMRRILEDVTVGVQHLIEARTVSATLEQGDGDSETTLNNDLEESRHYPKIWAGRG